MNCSWLHAVPPREGETTVRLWCLRYWKIPECATCQPALPPTLSNHTRAATRPTEGPEFVCFDCALPECDQNSPRCRYEMAKAALALVESANDIEHTARAQTQGGRQ